MLDEIIRIGDFKKLQEKTPFLIHLPEELEVRNSTYREPGRKWATLRFECTIGNEKLRVKEFFLDWFYPGFPKSLMDSFVSSYSILNSTATTDSVIFYGKNYKGKEASSSFSLGTQIEIEGETNLNVRKLTESLIAPYISARFKNYPFYKRSFLANNGKPEWFEEERIGKLSWNPPSKKFCEGNLCMDSVGVFRRDNKTIHAIFVLSEDYYRKAVWIDIGNPGASTEHVAYEFRKGGNFFDLFEEGETKFGFRRNDGPAIIQFEQEGSIVTISFSSLYQLSEVRRLGKLLREAETNLNYFATS